MGEITITGLQLSILENDANKLCYLAKKLHGDILTIKSSLPGGKYAQGWREQKSAHKIPIKIIN